ncbi:MAG: M42 family metallopeptidase [Nanoarchaeota archaeon]|nr:M42 family metallopeptidase [Nanoarchaeota archaeon]
MKDLLKELVNVPSVTGYEKDIADLMVKKLKPYVNSIKIDKIGNVIAKKGSGSPKIMIAAHMDKIGFIVKYIDGKGFIRFEGLGGFDDRTLLASKVKIHGSKGSLIGVIGAKPPHVQDAEEMKQIVKMKELFIDIGAKSKNEVEDAGISIGDHITLHSEFNKLIGSRVTGPAFDNRVGCLILLEIAKQIRKFKGTLYIVGTIQEEMGLTGIRGSTFAINPDVVIGVDTTIPGDVPEMKEGQAPVIIGEGPSLEIRDAISVIHPQVKKMIIDVAKKKKLPLQLNVLYGGATDASVVNLIREGIPGGSLSIPTRYLHTGIEVLDMKDVESEIKLLLEVIKEAHNYF